MSSLVYLLSWIAWLQLVFNSTSLALFSFCYFVISFTLVLKELWSWFLSSLLCNYSISLIAKALFCCQKAKVFEILFFSRSIWAALTQTEDLILKYSSLCCSCAWSSSDRAVSFSISPSSILAVPISSSHFVFLRMLTLFCSSSRLSRILFCSIMSLTLSIYFCLWMELDLNWSSSDLNLLICLCLSARPLSILRSWASLLLRACKLFNRSSLDLVIDSEISYCSFTISLQWVVACKMLKPTKILSISF